MRDSEYIAIKERAAGHLLKLPQVTAVGLGPREQNRRYTGEIAIKVFVRRKRPLDEIPEAERIPSSIEGVPTDVEELGEVRRAQSTEPGTTATVVADIDEQDPLRGGVSLAAQGVPGHGTMGCLLQDRLDPSAVYGLTNHHVVTHDGKVSRSRIVSHPSFRDSNLNFGFNVNSPIGVVAEAKDVPILDAAVVRIDPLTRWLPMVHEIGFLTGSHELTVTEVRNGDYKVRKRGIRTRLTHGVIACIEGECLELSTNLTLHNELRKKNVFVRSIDTAPAGRFMDDGDSGSVLVNENNEVVGLLYASDPQYGFGVPIGTVFRLLNELGGFDLKVATPRTAQPNATNEVQMVPMPAGVATIPIAEQIAKGRHEPFRPLKGGLQIQTEPMLGDANVATLGCFVVESNNAKAGYILTSYGAVSAEGTLTPSADTKVGQPKLYKKCSGCCRGGVGKFSKGGPTHHTPIAIVRLEKDQAWVPEIEHIGPVRGHSSADVDNKVMKYGAGTKLTGGTVVHIDPLPDDVRPKVLADSFLIKPEFDPSAIGSNEDVHFSRFADRGAAIVDLSRRVVGILYDNVMIADADGRKVFYGVAARIDEALQALATHAGVAVEIDATDKADDVRIASARVALESIEPAPEWSEVLPEHLTVLPATQLLESAWREHERELRDLVDRNRRVATAWHRCGGPEMLQAIMRASQVPDSTLPANFNGQPASACLDRLAHTFEKFGSATLRADIARIRSLLPSPGGLSLTGWLDALNATLVPNGR
jgi:hypothetical protein